MNDKNIKLYKQVIIPTQKSECHDNEMIHYNTILLSNFDEFNNIIKNNSNYKHLYEYNDRFHTEVTEVNNCGIWPNEKDQIYQYLFIPDKITSADSYSNNKTVYIKYNDTVNNDVNINNYIFKKGSCDGIKGINKITPGITLHDKSSFKSSAIIPTDIEYKNHYDCNVLPLSSIQTYNSDNIKHITKGINDYNDFDINANNPIINIDNTDRSDFVKISYISIPEIVYDPISEVASNVYTITKSQFDGEPIEIINTPNMEIMKNGSKQIISKDRLSYYGINSNKFDMYSSFFNSNLSNDSWYTNNTNSLYCPGSFVSGYKIKKSDDKYTLTPHCVKYDVTSSVKYTACPAENNWPVTNYGATASNSCAAGYKGSITRRCNNGVWDQPISNCEIIKCPTSGDWESNVPGTYTLSCNEGIRTRVCSSDGTWEAETATCKTSNNKLVCSEDNGWAETEVGKTVTKKCENDSSITLTRECINSNGNAVWKDVVGTCKSSANSGNGSGNGSDSDTKDSENNDSTKTTESNTTMIIIIIIAVFVIIILIIVLFKMFGGKKKQNENDDD